MKRPGEIAIGLLWHSANSGNLGVGALTVGNISLIRDAAQRAAVRPRFTIIGSRDAGARYVTGDDIETLTIDTRSLLSPSGYWRTLGTLDCVLDIGAGDSFADIYGAKRFGFLWLTKAMALARGVPLVLSPQTIGPFTRQPWRALAAFVMRRAKAIVARDPLSFAVAQELAPATRTVQSVDVAFALPYAAREWDSDRVDVGINVSGLLFNRGYSGANEFGMEIDYPALNRRLIAALTARADVRVHLICHVNARHMPADDDGRVADLLAAEFPQAIRVPDFASPGEAKSYISGLDLLIAGRMHACIAAFSIGVPVVPVAYSRKFSGLFDGVLGYPHSVPVKGMNTDAALAYLLDRFEHRDELRASVAAGNMVVADALARYGAELDRLFGSLAR